MFAIRRAVLASKVNMLVALGFMAAVLIDIWLLRPITAWGDALPAACAALSFVGRRESVQSLGLTARQFTEALRAWAVPLAACLAAAGVGCAVSGRPVYLLVRGAAYFAWCALQQFLLQDVVYRNVRAAAGPTWASSAVSGILFAIVHAPNPILAPATLLWGMLSTRLFERHPSVFALALLQTLLSALLLWATPPALSHDFRVGPGYWLWHAHHQP